MQLDPKLRERILRVLRFAVPALEFEHMNTDDFKEAYSLMNELEQGVLFFNGNKETIPIAYSEKQCMDAGIALGMKPQQCSHFYHQYNSQGWVKGNGLPISDLTSMMYLWKKNGYSEPEPVRNKQGKTPRELDIERRGGK